VSESIHKFDGRIFWNRPVPRPKWHEPLRLFRWLRRRTELTALNAVAPASAVTEPRPPRSAG
jgi:hypothetical protein